MSDELSVMLWVLAIVLMLTSCLDNGIHKITCYSGGTVIYSGETTGGGGWRSAAGWRCTDAKTGEHVYVQGDCVGRRPQP